MLEGRPELHLSRCGLATVIVALQNPASKALLILVLGLPACGRNDARDGPRPGQGGAPERQVTAPPAAQVCDMRFAGIRLVVRAADGQPVNDARVEVRTEAGGTLVRVLTEALDGSGGYVVLDDALPGAVTPPVAYVVTAVRGERSATARVVAGADPSGCHVSLLSGPLELVIR